MSQFKHHNLSKSAERLSKEISDSPSLWDDDNPEKEQEMMTKVKQQWRKKQHREFTKLQKEENQRQSINNLFSKVFILVISAIALPFIPLLWKVSVESFVEFLPKEKPAMASGEKKTGFLNRLKEIQTKYNSKEKAGNEIKEGDKTKLGDQLVESLDNIDKYNQNLKKAIDMSDGKPIDLPEQK